MLRQGTKITENVASNIVKRIKELKEKGQFFQREHAEQAATEACPEHLEFISKFVGLAYRVSGARVVNAEGHFPQANLAGSGISQGDLQLADESIFWDMFVDAAISYLHSATSLTLERIDRLSFVDIATLRSAHQTQAFIEKFDDLLRAVKVNININDPEQLFLTCHEISEITDQLKRDFYDQLGKELKANAFNQRLPGIYEATSAALQFTLTGASGSAFGLLTSFLAIPEMTTAIDKRLTENIKRRIEYSKNCLSRITGLSYQKRTALIDMYGRLVKYGLPD